MRQPIAFGDRSTFETLCPACAAARFPLAFPVATAPDAELEKLGEIYAHDLDDDPCLCSVCGEDLTPESDDDDCPDCTPRSRCDDCERSFGPMRY